MDIPTSSQASISRRTVEATNSQGSLLPTHHHNISGGESDGGYIPPTSELTSSNHDKALGVIDAAFKQTDQMVDERDMKAFGESRQSHLCTQDVSC
jgi:hypothetical protein